MGSLRLEVMLFLDFPGSPGVENLPAKAGDMGAIPGLETFHCLRETARVPQLLSACALRPVLSNREATATRSPLTSARE